MGSTNDKFKKVGASTVTALASPGKAIGATSINVGSTTNYPTTTGIIIAIRTVDTNGELVAGTYTEFSATVSSGTSLAIVATPVYGADQIYAAGATTQVFIPTSAYAQNTLIDGILVHADQDGTLKAGAVDVAAVLATDVVETAKIKDLNVTVGKLGNDAVETAKIKDLNVTTGKLAVGSVTGTKLGLVTGCELTKSATQSIAESVITIITFNGENFDTDTMHDNATNNSRITIKTAGLYVFYGLVDWAYNVTGARLAFFYKNGVTTNDIVSQSATASGSTSQKLVSQPMNLAVNDYVELAIYQNSGGAINVNTICKFSAIRIGTIS